MHYYFNFIIAKNLLCHSHLVQNVTLNTRMKMAIYIYPECAHEWSKNADAESAESTKVVRDANGNTLQDGDTITVIKDLKVKGSSSVVKVGTKVKNIRLVDGDHDIDC